MQDTPPLAAPDLAAETDGPFGPLYRALHADAGAEGFFDQIGPNHAAQFTDGSDTLLVVFEQAEALLRGSRDGQPLARAVQNRTDVAQMTLLAKGDTWFRAPEIYSFFDDLIDDGFFEAFRRVVFYGAGAQGYAAAAYSVAAPGAEVVLLQPHATLTPAVAGWDGRFVPKRRMDFTSRYGYGPAMMETAARGLVLVDPALREDFMHARLYARSGVDVLRLRYLGPDAEARLIQQGLIGALLDLVVAGDYNLADAVRVLRPRRDHVAHLNRVLQAAERSDNARRVGLIARHAITRSDQPRFISALESSNAALLAQGRSLPSARMDAARPGRSVAAAVLAVGGALGASRAQGMLPEDDAVETTSALDMGAVESPAVETVLQDPALIAGDAAELPQPVAEMATAETETAPEAETPPAEPEALDETPMPETAEVVLNPPLIFPQDTPPPYEAAPQADPQPEPQTDWVPQDQAHFAVDAPAPIFAQQDVPTPSWVPPEALPDAEPQPAPHWIPQDPAPQDWVPQDPQDTWQSDVQPQWVPQDQPFVPQEDAPQWGPQDTGPQDFGPQDWSPQEPAPQEEMAQPWVPQDPAPQPMFDQASFPPAPEPLDVVPDAPAFDGFTLPNPSDSPQSSWPHPDAADGSLRQSHRDGIEGAALMNPMLVEPARPEAIAADPPASEAGEPVGDQTDALSETTDPLSEDPAQNRLQQHVGLRAKIAERLARPAATKARPGKRKR